MMRNIFLILIIISSLSCGRLENSSSQDRFLYTRRQAGSALFNQAAAILSTKCSECHGSWSGYSESDFVQSGLVVAQNIDASKVYYRNTTASSGPGPRNMPTQGRPTLTAEETQVVIDWINSVTP